MSKEDSVGDHLKSDERKERKKEILKRASDVVDRNKQPTRPKRTPEEIQLLINDYRDQLHEENMQPPPPPEFVDEFGKPIFVDKSEIAFGGTMMPQRFKGSRTGNLALEPRDSLSDARRSNLNIQRIEAIKELDDGKEFVQDVIKSIKDWDSLPPQRATLEQEFKHTTDLVFRDLTTEEYREYMYDNGGVLRVERPWKLAISRSGNHRVATLDGFSYIIVPNWIAIRVKKKVGAPAFTF